MYSFIRYTGQRHSSSDHWSIVVGPYECPSQTFFTPIKWLEGKQVHVEVELHSIVSLGTEKVDQRQNLV